MPTVMCLASLVEGIPHSKNLVCSLFDAKETLLGVVVLWLCTHFCIPNGHAQAHTETWL